MWRSRHSIKEKLCFYFVFKSAGNAGREIRTSPLYLRVEEDTDARLSRHHTSVSAEETASTDLATDLLILTLVAAEEQTGVRKFDRLTNLQRSQCTGLIESYSATCDKVTRDVSIAI